MFSHINILSIAREGKLYNYYNVSLIDSIIAIVRTIASMYNLFVYRTKMYLLLNVIGLLLRG